MTIVTNDEYGSGLTSVKIKDGSKGSQVEVSIYAEPIAVDAEVEAAYRRVRHVIDATGQSELSEDLEVIGKHVAYLRSLVLDVDAAQMKANAIHLKTAAMVELNGGMITYDPEQRLLATWQHMEEHDAGQA